MYGPAIVLGLGRHLSRKAFAFLTQTGGPSWREARGSDATLSWRRNRASFPTRSKRESNSWNPSRWRRSANDRWALRSCGYRTSSVIAGAGIEIARRPAPRVRARVLSFATGRARRGLGKKNRSLGEAMYSRAAWTSVASCSTPTALATFRFGSTGSTTTRGSVKALAGGRSNARTVPGLHDRLASRTPRNEPCFRTRSSQRYPLNPRTFASAP